MLSPMDLERLITVKRREIEKEKTLLGLSAAPINVTINYDKERNQSERKVNFSDNKIDSDDAKTQKKEKDNTISLDDKDGDISSHELEGDIPADLERYIRRYLGLPVMLKAGEYSPNNPLVRAERSSGDVLLGLGEYERRRNTLRKLRQKQYREYLDQQAQKKQEAKEQAERERREREERDRERDERDRERELEREREREPVTSPVRKNSYANNTAFYSTKVDTAVQVGAITSPLSVAVQTDDTDFFQLPSPCKSSLTPAERELSPRTVNGAEERRAQPWHAHKWESDLAERRRSYGDFYERSSTVSKRTNRDKLTSELQHTYMPSIFDADAIQMRNLQAEKEAAERRQFYQQELKNQILEQQRIKEERKTREKMLEAAEMRRLEEQLRMLRMAQDKERGKQREMAIQMQDDNLEYMKKRTELQKEIDNEHKSLLRAVTHPIQESKPYYPRIKTTNDKHYSTNIPENSIFSPNYDVDSYLRRNLNFKETRFKNIGNKNTIVEKAIVHDVPREKPKENVDSYIPVLRHTNISQADKIEDDNLSEAMKMVDDKWKVPAVQKNILRSLPNDDGKNVSILTQLGSIRRQLQLEQLKLDKLDKEDV